MLDHLASKHAREFCEVLLGLSAWKGMKEQCSMEDIHSIQVKLVLCPGLHFTRAASYQRS